MIYHMKMEGNVNCSQRMNKILWTCDSNTLKLFHSSYISIMGCLSYSHAFRTFSLFNPQDNQSYYPQLHDTRWPKFIKINCQDGLRSQLDSAQKLYADQETWSIMDEVLDAYLTGQLSHWMILSRASPSPPVLPVALLVAPSLRAWPLVIILVIAWLEAWVACCCSGWSSCFVILLYQLDVIGCPQHGVRRPIWLYA